MVIYTYFWLLVGPPIVNLEAYFLRRRPPTLRILYTILFYLALPLVMARLLWRSRRQAAYRQRLPERLGWYPFKLDRSLWVHAVSVGEVIAAVPLINQLKAEYPDLPIIVTTMTITGSARVTSIFGNQVHHVYLPYDLPGAIRRFIKAMNPTALIVMETELWPNLIAVCQAEKVPVCLTNARLSLKSMVGYQKIGSLVRETLKRIDWIAANSQADADRFIALGAIPSHVSVTGNIKFDLTIDVDLQQKTIVLKNELGADRLVWVAASTHPGEEEIVLAAHRLLREKQPNALLILVPRHPERFNAVTTLSETMFKTQRRSHAAPVAADTAVYVSDTMGELMLMYSVSDVAFVGGSLTKNGGHNMLEPAALEKPIIVGQHLFNFADISELFFQANAMTKVNDSASLATALVALMSDANERTALGLRGKQVVEANRGALAAQMAIIKKWIATTC